MQLDLAQRGFSFMRDGPFDIRKSQSWLCCAELVHEGAQGHNAGILFHFG